MNGYTVESNVVAAGQPGGRYRSAVTDCRITFGERRPTDAVDGAGRTLGPRIRPSSAVYVVASNDRGGAERDQIGVLGHLAGAGHDLVATPGQE